MNAFNIPRPARARRGPDLTPVMDVVFILVVFFLVVSTFSETLVKPIRVTMPAAAGAPTPQAVTRLTLSASGATLNAQPVEAADLASRLAELSGDPLMIETTGQAPYQALVDALDAAQLAGITSVSVQAAAGPVQ